MFQALLEFKTLVESVVGYLSWDAMLVMVKELLRCDEQLREL
jgi:hypothetical protein